MKFRVERDVLAEAVTWVARGLPARPPVPVLATGDPRDRLGQDVALDAELHGSTTFVRREVSRPARAHSEIPAPTSVCTTAPTRAGSRH